MEEEYQEENISISDLKNKYSQSQSENAQLGTAVALGQQENSNLIQYQLDTSEILLRIENFLKGSVLKTDKVGNEFYAQPENKALILFNDYGVNAIMNTISPYIDKITTLSCYDEMRINEILADLGDELAGFIFISYDVMGMDTPFKKSRYPLVVLNILHLIESTYRRALRGKGMDAINSSRIFMQHENVNQMPRQPQPSQKKSIWRPSTW